MLALHVRRPEGKSKLRSVQKQVDHFMPLAEVLPESVPTPAIYGCQVRPFPRLSVLKLQNYCIGLVIEFARQSSDDGFAMGWYPLKKRIEIGVRMDFNNLKVE